MSAATAFLTTPVRASAVAKIATVRARSRSRASFRSRLPRRVEPALFRPPTRSFVSVLTRSLVHLVHPSRADEARRRRARGREGDHPRRQGGRLQVPSDVRGEVQRRDDARDGQGEVRAPGAPGLEGVPGLPEAVRSRRRGKGIVGSFVSFFRGGWSRDSVL